VFFEFNQNNSYGRFDVNERLCHRVFIEADSLAEATYKAEDLGCYWNGVASGIDCPCCGDRWDIPYSSIDMDKLSSYKVCALSVAEWKRKFGRYEVVKSPRKGKYGSLLYGEIAFKNFEEYVQYLADEYSWTTPDARIFYKNGTVTEIFSARGERLV
jgi:hypothetical protein